MLLIIKRDGSVVELALNVNKRATIESVNKAMQAAESDILGMLLEIGLIGFLFILFNMIKAYRTSKEKLFESSHISIKMVILLLFICMIEYRHGAGNIRGVTLWFILFSSYLQNINVPALRRQKKYKYENIVSC